MLLRALITPAFTSRDRKPLNLAVDYFFKLMLMPLSGLGNKEQHQAVIGFAAVYVERGFHMNRKLPG
jgi:hypothetical protein